MKNRTGKMWFSLIMAVMLVVLAGCQAVSGVDLNKVFQNGATVKSSQATQTIALEFLTDTSVTPSADEQKALELFSKIKVTISEMKQQDAMNISIKGIFEYNKGQIPFQLVLNGQQYTLLIDGAKKPIVFNNMATPEHMKDMITLEMQQQMNDLAKKAEELAPSIVSYIIGNAPNPKTISVGDEKFNVRTEGINGKKIHVEIKGSELLGLVKGFLTNVAADEKGLKELLGQIYDLFAPVMQQAMKENSDPDNPIADTVAPYLNNKTLAVEFAFTFINAKLKEVLANYDLAVQDMFNTPGSENGKLLLSDSTYMKMDVFADNDLMPRKSELELMIPLGSAESSVKSVKITSSSEMWDINKPVTADTIDTSAGQLELNSLDNPAKILSVLDPKSQLYGLLKNDLKITKKEITMIIGADSGLDDSGSPYNLNGTVMVPARFVAERLDADVAWEPATQKVTVTDYLNGTVIVLNVGGNQASVNGMIKPLEQAAEITNGSTYVPLRFITESLGAKISWDQATQTVTITRD